MSEALPVALQLYTVRDVLKGDFEGTLEQVAEMGYGGVEFAATLFGQKPEAVAGMLDRLGLDRAGYHWSFKAADPMGQVGEMIDVLGTLGSKWATCSGLPREFRGSPADMERGVAALNEVGAAMAEAGIRYGYHNHFWEFDKVGGTCFMDVMLAKMDPKVIDLQLDTLWVAFGGEDPAAYLRKCADRVQLLHVKDGILGGEPKDTPVGNGDLEFGPIMEAARAGRVKWLIVEQDNPQGGSLNCSAKSLAFLKGAGYA